MRIAALEGGTRQHAPLPALLVAALAVMTVAGARAAESATVVVLPPQIVPGDAETRRAAEVLCDRLAGEIAGGGVSVVDRTQLGKVLAERALTSRPAAAALAYDAMVRVTVDTDRAAPQVTVEVIDLSLGNRLDTKSWRWQGDLPGPTVSNMARMCRSAVRLAAGARGGRVKVRLTAPIITDELARLEPLAERLSTAFAASIDRSDRLVRVRHFEAASAAEESLLILTGLTRLPDGRQFAPQADATVRLRISETDSAGNTFPQTPVRIETRVDTAGEAPWARAEGTVAEWDKVVAAAWAGATERLAGADARAATDFLDEMALRRRQAEAELAKLHVLGELKYKDNLYSFSLGDWTPAQLRQIAALGAAASKLDPTHEEAAYLSVKFDFMVREHRIINEKADPREAMIPFLPRALWFYNAFPKRWHFHNQVASMSHDASMYVLAGEKRLNWFRFVEQTASDPPAPEVLDQIRELTGWGLSVTVLPTCQRWENGILPALTYRNMLAAGVPTGTCRAWRDRVMAKAEERLLQGQQVGRTGGTSFVWALTSLRQIMARWCLNEGRPQAARALLDDTMRRLAGHPPYIAARGSEFEALARRTGDEEFAERIRAWIDRTWTGQGLVGPLEVTRRAGTDPRFARSAEAEAERVAPVPDAGDGKDPARPFPSRLVVGVIADRLYLFSPWAVRPAGTAPWSQFGYVQLSPDGRVRNGRCTLLPRPTEREEVDVTFAVICGGRLCAGTRDSGLLIYDPGSGKWIVLGPAQGLPDPWVWQLLPLEGNRLLCYTRGKGGLAAVSVDVTTGAVTGMPRPEPGRQLPWRIWRAGKAWMGVSSRGVDHDVLGTWRTTPWPERTEQGWQHERVMPTYGFGESPPQRVSLARVGKRSFVDLADALRELDARGQIVRTWTKGIRTSLDPLILGQTVGSGWFNVDVPGVLPIGYVIACDEAGLIYDCPYGLMCFDPAADRWYGPVRIKDLPNRSRRFFEVDPCRSGIMAQECLWLGGEPLVCVRKADLVRAAEAAGLVATSDELARRLDRAAGEGSPMDRAKFALGRRRLAEARDLLAEILREDPDDPEAVLLMGLVHDRVCLNRPDDALEYYRRLAKMTGRPDAVVSGLELQCRWHVLAGDLEKALRIGQEGAALPGLFLSIRGQFEYLTRAITKEIADRQAAAKAE
ncbi:MAG TPA: hypothetical protein VFJ30_18310 [Phycisphaerae bacterium]|nr:hypothetical protein [Phycisphaerae bacterium]